MTLSCYDIDIVSHVHGGSDQAFSVFNITAGFTVNVFQCILGSSLSSIFSAFSRFMNQYFLLIACLQLWSLITPVNPASTWGPLIFIFAVSATKEAWDDYNRYLSDKQANEKEVWVVKEGIRKHVWFFFTLSC